ncbi:LuxR family transcriptional regulator [Pseudomonas sp. NZIPFR-PS2]|nr:LuxR family transcriptional regulator [Pseudomonas sp. NZIPFR-PS2]
MNALTRSTEPGVVLIVDDTPDNLAMLSDALDDAGYMVLVALDGLSALNRVQRRRPDLILLDAMMPGLDGFETCRRLKAQPASADIPVVFMTGLTDTRHVVQGFEVGGSDYVTKPIQTDEVLARVAAHLRTSRKVACGKTNRDIGDILGLSPRTVNKHLEHVYVKLGVETRTAATSVALAAI